ncbi:probable disease resistance protein At5g63020 [Andrographis paniculata]|uniref:probable disease resistance protein At5g63020 n=1 Tax=Andrographis paniculata TaxID=175694 RepID=UPI0021E912CA|nr:probable disease resistance protein At5g63020 [Andrographis paniculata]
MIFMEFIGPILEIFICLCDCMSKKANTILNLQNDAKALENALEQLNNVFEDVKRIVALEEERQMVPNKQVDGWLCKVESANKSVGEVLEKSSGMRSGCLSCFGCWSRYKLGKEVRVELKAVEELRIEGNFESVAEAMPRGVVDERPSEDSIGLDSVLEQVKRWIEDSEVKVIGIHGMGGVGKTTLLKMINNSFLEENYGFDQVIWVVVSKHSSVERIQDAICEQLKLPENVWKNKGEDEKAVQIFKILNVKKFVLMLDDLWRRVDLVKVGVPAPDNRRISKVVFTTRFEDVCGYMESDKQIKIECLTKDKALALFKKKVGTTTLNAHPIIPKRAEILANECKGLPLAIITVGRAMSGKRDLHDWDRAVTKLRKDPSEITGMEDDVFRILKFSYDSLRNDTIRSCFAYCCIYPEDHEILVNDLLALWVGEGFLDQFDDVHEAFDQGQDIIKSLKAASLLEDGESEEYVKMHDVIHDMALWISGGSKTSVNRYLVIDHVDVLETQLLSSRVEAERVSLWGSSFRTVPEVRSWPNALTFVARDTAVRVFPSQFLQFMAFLKVLDLSRNAHLAELPSGIGELVQLQFLNLSHTRIRELPVELKNLTKMKYLLLNSTYRMETIPRQVISSFSMLRVLRLFGNNSASYKDVENNILSSGRRELLELLEGFRDINDISITLFDRYSIEKLKNSYKILNCLSSLCLERCEGLTRLEFSSSSIERMRHLQRLDIYYCEMKQLIIHLEFERSHAAGISRAPDQFISRGSFRSLSSVYVAYCDELLDLTWLTYDPMLELLDVAHCASMVEVVSGRRNQSTGLEAESSIFSRLKRIRLINVPCLQSVYPHPLSFPSLVEMHVLSCRRLQRLPFDSRSGQGSLKEIRGSHWWWSMLQWEDEMLQPLFHAYFVPE